MSTPSRSRELDSEPQACAQPEPPCQRASADTRHHRQTSNPPMRHGKNTNGRLSIFEHPPPPLAPLALVYCPAPEHDPQLLVLRLPVAPAASEMPQVQRRRRALTAPCSGPWPSSWVRTKPDQGLLPPKMEVWAGGTRTACQCSTFLLPPGLLVDSQCQYSRVVPQHASVDWDPTS